MVHSTWENVLKQIQNKPAKLKMFMKHSKPKKRSCGYTNSRCRRCKRPRSVMRSYGLMLCRQCFRENAKKIGFKQYS